VPPVVSQRVVLSATKVSRRCEQTEQFFSSQSACTVLIRYVAFTECYIVYARDGSIYQNYRDNSLRVNWTAERCINQS